MAGLFDNLSGDPVLQARIAAAQRQAQAQQRAVDSMSDPWGKVGAAAGSLLGSLGGGYIANKLGYVSPEMQAAQQQASVIKALQGADLTTSAGLFAAAKSVRDLGDNVTALKLTERAGTTKLAENKVVRQQLKDTKEAQAKAFGQLPPDAKLAQIVSDPSVLRDNNPDLTDEQVAAIQDKASKVLNFRMAAAAKRADEVKGAKQTDVSGVDVSQTGTELNRLGFGPWTFENGPWGIGMLDFMGIDNKEAFGQFTNTVADRAQSALDRLAKKGIRTSKSALLTMATTMAEQGKALTRTAPDDISGLNENEFYKYIDKAEEVLLGAAQGASNMPATPAANTQNVPSVPETGSPRRLIPYNPNR